MTILRVQQISKQFGGVSALDDVSIDIEQGAITALVGPNGAGKTTLFDLIGGFIQPDSGEILFKSQPIGGLPPEKIAALGIGRTFQSIRLFLQMPVLENVMLASQNPRGETLAAALCRSRRVVEQEAACRRRALELLGTVGLQGCASEPASHLSQGQKKLLEIARCLALGAELMLLDEPLAGLAPAMIKEMKQVVWQLRGAGKTILFIDHNIQAVMELSDIVVVLSHGTKLAQGPPSVVQQNRDVIQAFLGKSSCAS
jgi:ABC-type branched-subunit amino acid transport system ATPase component